jgi:serine/threonine protein kinase
MHEQIGKYRIDSELGRGAMGVVYKAFDPHIERVVALKTIRKELLQDRHEHELVARFKNEAQASGRLTHPNIVAVYDYGETQDAAFIAMEYVEGNPLSALLTADRPTEVHRVILWMAQLLRALAYAHSKGVVHRDIKPANLLITPEGELKITDFGIAHIQSSTLTQTGSMIGTPSYMSPEQFRGAEIDGRSDVFSAGIVFYQLLTGIRPFTGSATVVMHQILNQEPVLPSSMQASVGARFDTVLRSALAKNPVDRFENATVFLDALLRGYRAERGGSVSNEGDSAPADVDQTVLAGQAHSFDLSGALIPDQERAFASRASASGASAVTMTPWKLAALPELERVLARQIGPMAKLLIKNASRNAPDIDALCSTILVHISTASGKAEFKATVDSLKSKFPEQSAISTGSPGVVPAPAPGGTSITGVSAVSEFDKRNNNIIDPGFVTDTEKILTRYIGAIAKIVIRRAMVDTQNKGALIDKLASQIANVTDREKFLKELTRV